MSLNITPVKERDFEEFFALIVALADYEQLAPPNNEAKARLRQHAFMAYPKYEAFLARMDDLAVGYAIVFETYSSFLAKPTLYLEDLFVLPAYRKQKVGYGLMKHLVSLAVSRECGRMEWQVLDWNQLAIDFYHQLGATHLKEWKLYRLTEDALRKLHDAAP
jgi:GNAT superfamily N-acetyltransferase